MIALVYLVVTAVSKGLVCGLIVMYRDVVRAIGFSIFAWDWNKAIVWVEAV